jgi:predicted glycogen debranching enzyme
MGNGSRRNPVWYAEDLFNPCTLTFELNAKKRISVIASTESHVASSAGDYRKTEIDRRSSIETEDELVSVLTTVANQFIVAREHGETVIAGYHWFADWGRDTMIALPGLTLSPAVSMPQSA